MDNNNIIDANESDFENRVINESDNKLIIVDFWAPWCGPCKQLTPIMEKVAKENNSNFNLVKINIDDNQQLAAQLRIQSIPAVYAFKNKKVVNAFQGVISEKEFQEIDEFISSLDEEMKKNKEIIKITKKIKIVKDSKNSDSIEILLEKHNNDPENIKILLKISEYYFSAGEYESAFSFLISNYSKDREKIKKKLLEFFEALGADHEATKTYRKKFSSLLFA